MATPERKFTSLATAGRGLTLTQDPEAVLTEAQRAAKVLMEVVNKMEWKRNFGTASKPRWHIYVEGWEFLAHMYGIMAREVETVQFEHKGAIGFKSTYEAVQHTAEGERILSRASATCLDDEDNWSLRPKYEYDDTGKRTATAYVPVPHFQLSSMAQTRATSRVLSEVLRFVVALAGYQGTPAEEMGAKRPKAPERKPEAKVSAPGTVAGPEHKQPPSGSAADEPVKPSLTLNEAQVRKVYEIAEQNKVSDEQMIELCGGLGYEKPEQVPVNKFANLLNSVLQARKV